MRFTLAFILLLLTFALAANGLHFYLEDGEQKCFNEDLPKETRVIGVYKAEVWSSKQNMFIEDHSLGIDITVDERGEEHKVLHIKGAHKGRFSFTSTESGEHDICFVTNTSSWWVDERIRFTLDLDIGEPIHLEENHSDESLSDMINRVRELNSRALDALREQSFQREIETKFRDMSERANSQIVWWSISQMAVLGMTCMWQMRHLRSFFIKKKLV
ncbi:uncharacterized protein VTP21DRAFT_74 [Calcarisporiella thermophila]|uniref:uncharacterized protein n=1 Tax=Calcarisporiella thermophila TaxID=911321 RepID=UPI003742AF44